MSFKPFIKLPWGNSLGSRLFLYVLAGALVGLGSMSFWFYRILEQQAENEIENHLSTEVKSVERKLAEIERTGDNLGIAIAHLQRQNIQDYKVYEDLIFQFYQQRPPLNMAVGFGQKPWGILGDRQWYWPYFYQDQGVPGEVGNLLPAPYQKTRFSELFKDDNYPIREYYTLIADTGKATWMESYQWYGVTMTTYLAPIINQNQQLLGMVGLDVNVTAISEEIKITVLPQGGYFAIISQKGNLLAYPPDPAKAKALDSYKDISSIKTFWKQKNPQQSGFLIADNTYWAYQVIGGTNWIMIASVPRSIVLKPVLAITLGGALGAGTILGLVVMLFIRQLNKRLQPIVEECKQLIHLESHNLDQTLPKINVTQHGDEIEILSQSFHEMTRQLTASLEQLEHRVAERTATLSITLEQLKKSQIQVIQSEKMSSLGQLVAGVAHEINNPVNFIHGNITHADQYTQDLIKLLELYQQFYPEPFPEIQTEIEEIDLDFLIEDLQKLIKSMRVGTERIKEIVKSLRNFSRLDEAEVKEADINEGIDSTLMILQNRLKATSEFPAIAVIKNYGNIPLVECYPGQLNQVFMNLIGNAIDALNDYRLSLNESEKEAFLPSIWIETKVTEKNWLSIRIADNGLGISQDIKDKLFDPFFTTKAIGKGTGLGLSISYQIITEKHHGILVCDSTPEGGAAFCIEIPIMQG